MKCSIIIPYNKDRGYLGDAIKSCEDQEFDDFEIIVQHGFKSTAENINDAIEKCNGDYIKLCGEDDILLPNCLRDLYNTIQGFDVSAAHCINFTDGYKKEVEIIREIEIPKDVNELAKRNTLHGLGMLYRKQAVIDIGMFDESLDAFEEVELHLCLLHYGYSFVLCDSVVGRYRLHPHQKSHKHNNKPNEKERKAKRDKIIKKWTYQ